MKKYSLSIIIPTYNELNNIDRCIEELHDFCQLRSIDYELVVVNDGSNDGTTALLRELCKKDPKIVVITNIKRLGYASALKRGIDAARKEYMLFFDADMQFNIDDLDRLIEKSTQYPLVLTIRSHIAGNIINSIAIRGCNVIFSILLGIPFKDSISTLKLVKKDLFNDISLVSKSICIHGELLSKLYHKSNAYSEVYVTHFRRKYNKHRQSLLFELGKSILELGKLKSNLVS